MRVEILNTHINSSELVVKHVAVSDGKPGDSVADAQQIQPAQRCTVDLAPGEGILIVAADQKQPPRTASNG